MLDFFSPPTPKSADRANKDNVREFNDLKYRGTSSSLLSVVAGGVVVVVVEVVVALVIWL